MVIRLTGGALVQRLQQVRVAGGAPYVSEALQGSKGVFSLLQEHLLFLPGLTCSVSIPGTECSCTREEKLVSALQEFMATYENHCQGADHLPGVQTGSRSSKGSIKSSRACFLTEKVDLGP